MLIAITVGLFIYSSEFEEGQRRIFVGCFGGALIVISASLLTRMHLQFLAEIKQLESQGKET